MYTSFFGLNEKPFSITPDPRYLFLSARHGEALAHLVYGVTESGGFIQLTGEVGTGKTTLVRSLLQNRMPSNADVAVVLNPQQSPLEFVASICGELHVPVPEAKGSIKVLIDALNQHLLAAHADGRRTILVVDEAQNLTAEVLEQVRLLTNLETAKQKLLQIILIGQPELRELLARNNLRQLAQRVTGRYHLEPLSRAETAQYIEHRLQVAGALGEVFDVGAKREVFRLSQGVPRLVNVICDRALLGAYSREIRHINRRLIRRAATEVSGKRLGPAWLRWAIPSIATIGAVIIAVGLWTVRGLSGDAGDELIDSSVVVATASAEAAIAAVDLPEAEVMPEPGLDEQLQLAADMTGRESALTRLFELWQVESGGDPQTYCSQAATVGMSCFFQRGSWSGLRQLDRPAILTLIDSNGNNHAVILTAIDDGMAVLSIGGVTVTHPVDSVSELWFGQYMLLWKPPNAMSVSLGPGVRNQNVIWLRQSLATINPDYASEPFDSDAFDADLEKTVRQFQRDHRLGVDGLAGQQTQIVINSLLAMDGAPRLTVARLTGE